MHTLSKLILLVTGCLFANIGLPADRTMFVLDASGSMWAQIKGKSKVEIARETLAEVLKTLPADREIGLVAYGHRNKGDCKDIETLVSPKAGTADTIIKKVNALSAMGKTPLTDAVRQASLTMNFVEDKATVVLITDGLETCDADPCQLAKELEKQGVDFTAHVVGFGLTDAEGKKVACLAENTGGQYFPASDAKSLVDALEKTVQADVVPKKPEPKKPEPKVLKFNLQPTVSFSEDSSAITDKDEYDNSKHWKVMSADKSKEVVQKYGASPELKVPAGDYYLTFDMGSAITGQPITVTDDKLSQPHLTLNAGIVHLTTKDDSGKDVGASTNFAFDGGKTHKYGKATLVLPAGDIRITSKWTNNTVEDTITLKAGETINKDIVFAFGRVNLTVNYAEGGPVVKNDLLRVDIFAAKKSSDGDRQSLMGEYAKGQSSFDIAPGEYVAQAKLSNALVEVPLTIEANTLTEKSLNLNAGVVAVTAPQGTTRIDVLTAEADLQGNRKNVTGDYAAKATYTLTAGKYLIRATLENDKVVEKTVEIIAAKREKITLSE